MNMKFLFLALLAVASLQVHAQASSTADAPGTQIPVDFDKPVELEIEIEVPSEHTSIEKLSEYLDRNGFSLHINVAFEQSGEELELQRQLVRARKFGTVSPEEFNTLSKRVSELVEPFGGSPKWTFRQQRKSS
ncbi:hypothetical protein [uncultured Luteimonas sp.]|uniref:hypothetical protein n=1 Tax=uncultured Luteimonas sp. TaxID=453144 RepID=UPI00261C19F9|nr:hypothetical protein [uncultured Luteimonas sp.]